MRNFCHFLTMGFRMNNSFSSDISVGTSKKHLFNSFNIDKAIKHIRFLPRSEKLALRSIILRMPFSGGEYDLNGAVTISNGMLAYDIDYGIDTARKAKEGLQARSIFTLDGRAWSEKKPFTMAAHTIKLTPAFVTYLSENIRNKKTGESRRWGYCDGYVQKISLRSFKEKISKAIHRANQVCLALVHDVKESTPSPLDSIKAYINRNKYIDNESIGSKPLNFTNCDGKISPRLINNKLLATLTKTDTTKVKAWTQATTDFCKALLNSGMTKVEVVRKMISSGYVRNAQEFERKYLNTPILQIE